MNSQPIFGRNSNLFHYSTVTEWVKREVSYDSIIMTFTICIKTSTLTKTTHYTGYQQKLFDEVKRLKEVEGLGYRRISYVLYDKGYRGIRKNSILRYNYIYSIYHKGKIREKRINRKFKTVVKDIMIYESKCSKVIIIGT
jgi:hypothetical protein